MKYSIFGHCQATRKSFAGCKSPLTPSLPMDDIIEVPCPTEHATYPTRMLTLSTQPLTTPRTGYLSSQALSSGQQLLSLCFCAVPESGWPCQESTAHGRVKKWEAVEISWEGGEPHVRWTLSQEEWGQCRGRSLGNLSHTRTYGVRVDPLSRVAFGGY